MMVAALVIGTLATAAGVLLWLDRDHRTMTGKFGEPDDRHLAFIEKQDARVSTFTGAVVLRSTSPMTPEASRFGPICH